MRGVVLGHFTAADALAVPLVGFPMFDPVSYATAAPQLKVIAESIIVAQGDGRLGFEGGTTYVCTGMEWDWYVAFATVGASVRFQAAEDDDGQAAAFVAAVANGVRHIGGAFRDHPPLAPNAADVAVPGRVHVYARGRAPGPAPTTHPCLFIMPGRRGPPAGIGARADRPITGDSHDFWWLLSPPLRAEGGAAQVDPGLPVVSWKDVGWVARRWAKGFTMYAAESVVARLKDLGYANVRIAAGAGHNPHGVLAALRQLATVKALAELVARRCSAVDSVYGSKRDLDLVGRLNSAIARDQAASRACPGIALRLIGQEAHPQDVARAVPMDGPIGSLPVVPARAAGARAGALFVNIYSAGREATLPGWLARWLPAALVPHRDIPLTPDWLLSLPYDVFVFVHHVFEGAFGDMDTASWVRLDTVEGPRVVFHADDASPQYGPHDPLDWLAVPGAHAGVTSGLAWGQAATLTGDSGRPWMTVTVAERRELTQVAQLGSRTPLPQGTSSHYQPPYTSVLGRGAIVDWLPGWLFDLAPAWLVGRRAHLSRGHVYDLNLFMSNQRRTAWTYVAVLGEARRLVQGDPVMRRIALRNPGRFEAYVEDLANHCFAARAAERAGAVWWMRWWHADHFANYNHSAAKVDSAPWINWWPLAATAAAGLALWWPRLDAARGDVCSGAITEGLRRVGGWAKRHWRWLVAGAGVVAVGWACSRAELPSLDSPWWAQAAVPIQYAPRQWLGSALDAARYLGAVLISEANVRTAAAGDAVLGAVDPETAEAVRPALLAGVTAVGLAAQAVAGPLLEDEQRGQNAVRAVGPALQAFGAFGGMTNVLAACTLTPALEEGIKRIFPAAWGGLLFGGFELLLKVPSLARLPGQGASLTLGLAGALSTVAMHHATRQMSYGRAFRTHAVWNALSVAATVAGAYFPRFAERIGATALGLQAAALCTVGATIGSGSAWAAFVLATQRHGMDARELRTVWPEISRYSETEAVVPAVNELVPDAVPPLDPAVHVEGRILPVGHLTERPGYFVALAHNAPLFRPGTSPSCHLAVAQLRLLRAPPEPVAVQAAGYAGRVATALRGLTLVREWTTPLLSEEASLAWRAHLLDSSNPNARRHIANTELLVEGPLAEDHGGFRHIAVNVKTDEVLLKPSRGQLKPRPIEALAPIAATATGPAVYELYQRMKVVFAPSLERQPDSHTREGVPLWVVCGSGCLVSDFDRVADQFMTLGEACVVWVAGDDMLVWAVLGGELIVLEGDLSQCDHSVRAPALEMELQVFRLLGMDAGTEGQLRKLYAARRHVMRRDEAVGQMTITYSTMRRVTGAATTTAGNTAVVAEQAVHTLATLGVTAAPANITAHWRASGYDLKLRAQRGPVSGLGAGLWLGSFLKGLFHLGTDGRYHWAPLTSRLLKAGKFLIRQTPIDRMYAGPGERLSLTEVAERHLEATAVGLLAFSLDPVLKGFAQKWAGRPRARRSHELAPRTKSETWKPTPDGASELDEDAAYRQLAWWYGIDEAELRAFAEHVAAMPVFSFSTHPAWLKLAERDYW